MIKVAVGHSEEVDSLDAVEDVLKMCQEDLGEFLPQAGILYTAIEYDHQVILNRIMDCYPQLELIGCTTDGEISSKLGFDEDSVTLMMFYADFVEIKAGCGKALLGGGANSSKKRSGQCPDRVEKKAGLLPVPGGKHYRWRRGYSRGIKKRIRQGFSYFWCIGSGSVEHEKNISVLQAGGYDRFRAGYALCW